MDIDQWCRAWLRREWRWSRTTNHGVSFSLAWLFLPNWCQKKKKQLLLRRVGGGDSNRMEDSIMQYIYITLRESGLKICLRGCCVIYSIIALLSETCVDLGQTYPYENRNVNVTQHILPGFWHMAKCVLWLQGITFPWHQCCMPLSVWIATQTVAPVPVPLMHSLCCWLRGVASSAPWPILKQYVFALVKVMRWGDSEYSNFWSWQVCQPVVLTPVCMCAQEK